MLEWMYLYGEGTNGTIAQNLYSYNMRLSVVCC